MQGESLDAENLPDVMRRTAAHFVAALQAMRGSQRLQPPALPPYTVDLTWDNAVYAGPFLRRGHVETQAQLQRCRRFLRWRRLRNGQAYPATRGCRCVRRLLHAEAGPRAACAPCAARSAG